MGRREKNLIMGSPVYGIRDNNGDSTNGALQCSLRCGRLN
jgi:hypothetical protein